MTTPPPTLSLLAQTIRYGLAGGTAALTLLVVLVLLVELVGCPKTLASVLAFTVATPINYGLQHRFVFRRRGRHGRLFVRYLGVTTATLALNTALFALFTTHFAIPYPVAQVVTVGIIVLVNFVLNRQFTFAPASASLNDVR